MVAQEAGNTTPMPRQRHHPAWNIVDRALGLAIPAYFGWRDTDTLVGGITGVADTIAGMDRRYTDNSVSVGGDQIGRDRIDDRSVGGDQRVGDDIDGSCIGDECRNTSPGPIDESDHSDNSDNSDNSGGSDDTDDGGDP